MKHTLLALALASAVSPVFAAASAAVTSVTAGTTYRLCDGQAGGGKVQVNGGSGAVVAAGSAVFTRNGFDVQCSSNVFLGAQEVSGNLAAVGSGSAKGNQYYGGHTNGGAITAGGKCTGTNDACTQANTDTAIAAAVTAGSS